MKSHLRIYFATVWLSGNTYITNTGQNIINTTYKITLYKVENNNINRN